MCLSRWGYARNIYTRESSKHRGVLKHPAAPKWNPCTSAGSLCRILTSKSKGPAASAIQRIPQSPANHISPINFQQAPAITTATKDLSGSHLEASPGWALFTPVLTYPRKIKKVGPAERLKQEDQKFKARFTYTPSLRPAWTTWDPVSKQTPQSKTAQKTKTKTFLLLLLPRSHQLTHWLIESALLSIYWKKNFVPSPNFL